MRLRHQFELIQIIRNFFCQQGFLDVLTPPAVENPGMEVHIHPFQLHSVQKKHLIPLYLHTSPEFCMKELLSLNEEQIDDLFSLSYCFRDEPSSPIHRNQFIMLEWYRKGARYERIMQDVEELIQYCLLEGAKRKLIVKSEIQGCKFIKKTMQEIFLEELGLDILNYLDVTSLKKLLSEEFPDVPVPAAELEWDDYFFLLYLNHIEPKLIKHPLLLIYEFPSPLSALSTLKSADPRVCERFEVYVNGIELCNAFNELTDPAEQRRRFELQNEMKNKLYGYSMPEPTRFYTTMQRGLPKSSGVAMGVERLLYSLFEIDGPFYHSSN